MRWFSIEKEEKVQNKLPLQSTTADSADSAAAAKVVA